MAVKFVANDAGFDALRTSPGADALIKAHAVLMEAAANSIPSTTGEPLEEPYYATHDAGDEHRARYRVTTTGARANNHEFRTHALQRALSSG